MPFKVSHVPCEEEKPPTPALLRFILEHQYFLAIRWTGSGFEPVSSKT